MSKLKLIVRFAVILTTICAAKSVASPTQRASIELSRAEAGALVAEAKKARLYASDAQKYAVQAEVYRDSTRRYRVWLTASKGETLQARAEAYQTLQERNRWRGYVIGIALGVLIGAGFWLRRFLF